MSRQLPHPVVVVGSGLIGLSTALLIARAGHRVTVLERDAAPPPGRPGDAWDDWERPGVNQFRHPHLMLPRWHQTVRAEMPELAGLLLEAGARPMNMLHLLPSAVTHGWRPGDEDFDTVAVRRPVLEACLARLVTQEPRVTVRRGARVTGLTLAAGPVGGLPHVHGVRLGDERLDAGLVVDCAGRRTPVPGFLARARAAPHEHRDPAGHVYWSRRFRTQGARLPTGIGPALTHHPSLSVLTLPGDGGTFSVALVARADDVPLRALRHTSVWDRVAELTAAGPWLRCGEPTSEVVPIAGIEDITRTYVVHGRPVATGVVAVGDSTVATSPFLGRGASLGLLQAVALRGVLTAAPQDLPEAFFTACAERVQPFVEATTWFDQHRLAEMAAEAKGEPYRTEDIGWAMSVALRRGAEVDPVLARASGRIGGLLDLPPDALGAPDVGARLGPWLSDHLQTAPTRADLLDTAAVPAGC